MEAPESEWEIQEYPSSKDGETTMARWILNKGYGIGKKMVITGVAISSAPLVLPQLVVFSAMGVVFSVPFGIVFVSYACTNKLMSKLLPMPPPSTSMLEYYAEEDEEEKKEAWEEDEFRRDNVIQRAEEEQLEDIKQGVVCRFELDEGGDGIMDNEGYFIDNRDELRRENVLQEEEDEQMEDIKHEGYDGYSQEVETLIMNADGIDEEGYCINVREDDELGQENVLQVAEEELMEDVKQGTEIRFELDGGIDGYSPDAAALITNVNGVADEEGCTIDDLQQQEDDDTGQENVLQEDVDKQMQVIGQGVETGFELGEGCDNYGQEVEVLITNAGGIINEEDYCINDLKEEGEEDDLGPGNVFQEDEDEQREDTKEGVEIGLEVVEGCDNYSQEAEASFTNPNGIVDEKGYYIDEDKKEGEDGVLGPENVLQEDHMKQGVGLDEGGDDYKQGTEALISNVDQKGDHANENKDEKEEEDDLRQRENVIKEEEKEQMEDIKQGVEKRLQLDVTDDDHRQTEEGSNTISNGGVDKEGYEEDTGEYIEGDDDSLEEERKEDEPLVETHRVVILVEENVETNVVDDEEDEMVKGSTGLLEKIRDEGKVDNSVEDDNILGESGSKDVEKKEPVMVKLVDCEKPVEGGSKNEDTILGTKKEDLIRSNEDAREIGDESGLDLFDDRNAGNYQIKSLEVDEEKEIIADENVDVVALPVFRKAKLDSSHAEVAPKTDAKVPSREGIFDEEKIWEQIGAMRAIVGYQAPRQATSIEELKALYVFTGVEPPASVKGDSDLDQVNAKLKFLMSIIGVK